jgi:hypothetical protein
MVEKKDGGKLLFRKDVEGILSKIISPKKQNKTTKYDPNTFNGREQILNRILIVNLLFLAKNCNTKTGGITEHIVCAYHKQIRRIFSYL